MARTYAQRIAGLPTAMKFNASSSEFLLQYQLDTVRRCFISSSFVLCFVFLILSFVVANCKSLTCRVSLYPQTITAPTEIYLHEAWYYPRGFSVTVQPAGAVQWQHADTNLVTVTATAAAQQGTQVTVHITAL